MSLKTGIITQARMGSTRLPGKIMLPIKNRPMLAWHLDRLALSGLPVIVATTTNANDDVVANFCKDNGILCHRGSESDVLDRFCGAAKQFDLDIIVRVCSDAPLIDGKLIAEGVAAFEKAFEKYLYLSNAIERTFCYGLDFEIFTSAYLDEANCEATETAEREHVTPYINRNKSGKTIFRHFVQNPPRVEYRLTVDVDADFELIRQLIEEYHLEKADHREIINLLDSHPELSAINADVKQKTH